MNNVPAKVSGVASSQSRESTPAHFSGPLATLRAAKHFAKFVRQRTSGTLSKLPGQELAELTWCLVLQLLGGFDPAQRHVGEQNNPTCSVV